MVCFLILHTHDGSCLVIYYTSKGSFFKKRIFFKIQKSKNVNGIKNFKKNVAQVYNVKWKRMAKNKKTNEKKKSVILKVEDEAMVSLQGDRIIF